MVWARRFSPRLQTLFLPGHADQLGHSMEKFRRMNGTKPKTSNSHGPASRRRGVDIGKTLLSA